MKYTYRPKLVQYFEDVIIEADTEEQAQEEFDRMIINDFTPKWGEFHHTMTEETR